ncbi:MAG: N-acetylmuramoyl-L-alanine amidase [Gammaproteobacteria bacterium]|nr:N-acetylmuramoyl-L-alanine amidase [Gammaproteobacteria bacterium]
MLISDENGYIKNIKVNNETRPAIEHGLIGRVNSIVLHRTGSGTATSVLNAWKTKKEGTHFLISETGKIYQTASLKKQCWHVGKLYARCRTTSSCTEEDAKAIESILHKKNTSWGKRFRLVTRHELKKDYPARFPHNKDSLGVEIVGVVSNEREVYEIPNKLQLGSLFWLLDEIILTYGLTLKDIFSHGKIAHKDKKKSEGASALKAYRISKAV